MKAYLDKRDGPFQPEPMGPRSAKAGAASLAANEQPWRNESLGD